MTKTALITGILGQDGSYLSELLICKGYYVAGTTHRQSTSIMVQGQKVPVLHMSLADASSIEQILLQVQPDEIYHLASRSSSTQLFDDPWAIADVNALSTMRFLEIIRKYLPETRFCQAGSSEVYAGSIVSPQNEKTSMYPLNAYGAAKAYARHLVNAYRYRYGLKACTAILFNHESPRRGYQYVTRKITRAAAAIALGLQKNLTLGSLDDQRDWGHAKDMMYGMWLMLQQEQPQDMVLATGTCHRVSDFCELAFSRVGLDYRDHVQVEPDPDRRTDLTILRGDATLARKLLRWQPQISFESLVYEMVDADLLDLRQSPILT